MKFGYMNEATSEMESVILMKMRTVLRILLLAIVMLAVAVPASADVWLPGSLTEIESQAFMNSAWLSGACTIPEGTKTIGSQAFYGCSGITSLKVASSVKLIGSGAFAGCTGLTGTVTIPEGCEVADDAFANCPNVTVVYEGADPSELFTWTISGTWENRASILASRRNRSLLLRKRTPISPPRLATSIFTEDSRITAPLG